MWTPPWSRLTARRNMPTPTFKGGFGYHLLAVWCVNTQEMLAVTLRPGNAGSDTAADHITVLTQAVAQVPAAYRKHMLVRADGAGSSHGCWTASPNRAANAVAPLSIRSDSPAPVRSTISSRSCRRRRGPPRSRPKGTCATTEMSPRSLPCWT